MKKPGVLAACAVAALLVIVGYLVFCGDGSQTFEKEVDLPWNLSAVDSIRWSLDGKRIAFGQISGIIYVRSFEGDAKPRTLKGPDGIVEAMEWSPDGKLLAAASNAAIDYSHHYPVRVWDVQAGKVIRQLRGHLGRVWGIAWSPDGASIATTGLDGVLKVWDVARGRELRKLSGSYCASWSPDGQKIASAVAAVDGYEYKETPDASKGRMGEVWSVATGKQSKWLNTTGKLTSEREMYSLDWSPDGKTIASGGRDGMVRVWDATTGKQKWGIKGHDGEVMAIRWNSYGNARNAKFISADSGLTYITWDAATGKQLQVEKLYTEGTSSASLSPDGRRVALARGQIRGASGGESVLIKDSATDREIKKFTVPAAN
jgi:WD40 repeat protein